MSAIEFYLTKARAGDLDAAFHGLRSIELNDIPALQKAYLAESDAATRTVIVAAVSERRLPTLLDFMARSLQDESPNVWKAAIDGIVGLASPAAIQTLRSALLSECTVERRAWIDEAIQQLKDDGL